MITTYPTTIYIWSAIGHTPITNRHGAYQDVLLKVEIECVDPTDAYNKTLEFKQNTKYAAQCYFKMPTYPNQNTRSKFCHFN